MSGKITVRNIPELVWNALEVLASKHDRSVEAEARHALRSYVEPLLQANVRSTRRLATAERLRSALAMVNSVRFGRQFNPSHIAFEIGEDYGEPVEEWFTGEREPSFSQLASVANLFGVEKRWLQFADEPIFPVESITVPDDSAGGVKWLLDIEESDRVTCLHLIREEGVGGSLVVVKQYGEWKCTTHSTQFVLSESIGRGGESALARLSLILELLYAYIKGKAISVRGYNIPRDKTVAITEGRVHPLFVLNQAPRSTWWEDIWDVDMFRSGTKYWVGFPQLAEYIYERVESSAYWREERNLIRSREHPLLLDNRKFSMDTKALVEALSASSSTSISEG